MPKLTTSTISTENTSPIDLTQSFTATDSGGTSYAYTAQDQLRVFLRFGTTITNLSSYSSNDTITLSYTNRGDDNIDNLIQSSQTIGQRVTETFFAEVRGGGGAQGNTALLTFGGASTPTDNITSFGDGSDDLPFSVSFWLKYSEAPPSGARILFEKGRFSSGAADKEYRLEYNNGGNKISFRLYDHNNGNAECVKVWSSQDLVTGNGWQHIAITYDGHGTGAPQDQHMTLYINGVDQESNVSTRTNGSYQFMDPASDELHIGSDHKAETEADAFMAEFAIWGQELTSSTVNAIYHGQLEATETSTTTTLSSGYVNLSTRLRLKDLDNLPGAYSVKHRMGDIDRTGNNTSIPFNDQKTLVFGAMIADNFDNSGFDRKTLLNSNKWNNSTGIKIRKELIQKVSGNKTANFVLVFEGRAAVRFLATHKKIKNPEIEFDLLQGPYNQVKGGLNLRKGIKTDTLLAQISSDNVNWDTIKTYTPSDNIESFYGKDNIKKSIFSSKKRINFSDIPSKYAGQEFYFRLAQTSISNNEKGMWGISKIIIKSSNQKIVFGLGVNSFDFAGNAFKNHIIANQNTTGTLSGTGRIISGIGDDTFKDALNIETITPFNEAISFIDNSLEFFKVGTDPNVIPNFTQPTKDKTKITINLNPSEETTFGATTKLSTTEINSVFDVSKNGSQLMVYWNNTLKRWEKRGQPFRGFNSTESNTAAGAADRLGVLEFVSSLSGTCVGFTGLTVIGTGSTTTPPENEFSFFDKSQTSLSFKPFDGYAFPFGAQYHATSSQYIIAKDIGITKPFLLEKISLEYESKFETPGTDNTLFTANYNKPSFLRGDPSLSRIGTANLLVITPTFFMLRQFKDKFSQTISISSGSGEKFQYTMNIPTNQLIDSGSITPVLVEDNRELITYTQNTLFVTSSAESNALEYLTVQDYIDAGIGTDLNTIIKTSRTSTQILSLTQSFVVNSNVRSISSYPNGHTKRYYSGSSPTVINQFLFGKSSTSRTQGSLKNARGIVNGFSAVEKKGEIIIPGGKATNSRKSLTGLNENDLDKNSPYIILPEDRLVLGWQYPQSSQLHDFGKGVNPGTDTTAFNSMTLFGKSNVHLYGSLISNGKEYHETTNQNLTSYGISETLIGQSKDIDRYQISYSNELTGSYIDKFLIDNSDVANIKFDDAITKNPPSRIGIYAGSIVNRSGSLSSVQVELSASIGKVGQIQKFKKLNSQDTKEADSGRRPSYAFDYKQFGNHIDLINGAQDTKFLFSKTKNTTFDQNLFLESPIVVQFVFEESDNVDDIDIKQYVRRNANDLVSFGNFQSSNIDVNCTSSVAFFDDNVPRNRVYNATDDFIAV
jgi:hypothetical protein